VFLFYHSPVCWWH